MSAATLGRRLSRLDRVPDLAIKGAAKAVVKVAESEGGTVVLGKKKRRVKLSAFARVNETGPQSAEVTVWGKPTGPWVWKSSGTSAHNVPKRPPNARRPRPMHARGFEHPVQRMQLHVDGARGHGAWGKVVKRSQPIVRDIFVDELHKAVNSG